MLPRQLLRPRTRGQRSRHHARPERCIVHTPTLLNDFDARQRRRICGSQFACHNASLMLDLVHATSTVATSNQSKAASAGRLQKERG
jgi:hypothetical protein